MRDTIAAAVASGVNVNEWVHESIECSATGTEPYTDTQFESTAHLVAAAHKVTGLPINRHTVVTHADINTACCSTGLGRERARFVAQRGSWGVPL